VLEAARDLFLAEGYAAVTMDLVAARAAVSKATVYTCFSGKEAAFAAVLEILSRQLVDGFEDPETLLGPPEDALNAFGTKLLRLLTRPRAVATLRLLAAESGRVPGLSGKFEARALARVHEALSRYLARESARGTLQVREPRLAAAQFLGMLKEPVLWPYVLGLRSIVFRPRETVRSACRVFLAAHAPMGAHRR
jgi:TetR/AcrR family transcriptional regulator of autoinduction and epiphytic fitness